MASPARRMAGPACWASRTTMSRTRTMTTSAEPWQTSRKSQSGREPMPSRRRSLYPSLGGLGAMVVMEDTPSSNGPGSFRSLNPLQLLVDELDEPVRQFGVVHALDFLLPVVRHPGEEIDEQPGPVGRLLDVEHGPGRAADRVGVFAFRGRVDERVAQVLRVGLARGRRRA